MHRPPDADLLTCEPSIQATLSFYSGPFLKGISALKNRLCAWCRLCLTAVSFCQQVRIIAEATNHRSQPEALVMKKGMVRRSFLLSHRPHRKSNRAQPFAAGSLMCLGDVMDSLLSLSRSIKASLSNPPISYLSSPMSKADTCGRC